MFCGNCGLKLPGDAKFCPRCGAQVEVSAASETVNADDELLKTQPIVRQPKESEQPLMEEAATEQAQLPEQGEKQEQEQQAENREDGATVVESEQTDATEQFEEPEQLEPPTNEQSWQGYQQQYQQDASGQPVQGAVKNNIQIFAIIMAAAAGIFAVYDLFHALQSFVNIFEMMHYLGWGYSGGDIFYALVRTGIIAIGAAGFVLLALASCMVYLKWDASRAGSYFTGMLVSGGLVIAAALVKVILAEITDYYVNTAEFAFAFLLAAVAVCGYFFLCSTQGINLAMGYRTEQMKADMNQLFSEIRQTTNDFLQSRNSANVQNNAQMAQGQSNRTFSVNQNARSEAYAPTDSDAADSGMPTAQNNGMLKTDRSLLMNIVLGSLTCGIYPLYILHTIGRDLNIACDGDGYRTAGIVKLVLLSFVTCGIYTFVWYHQVGNRLQDNASRYGLSFRESGTTVLLWMLSGVISCGIGSLVAVYIVLRNTNEICAAYNASNA